MGGLARNGLNCGKMSAANITKSLRIKKQPPEVFYEKRYS